MENPADQRKFTRLSKESAVEIYPVFPSYGGQTAVMERAFFRGQLRDLSEGGIGLSLETHLLAGSIMKFHFALNPSHWVEIFGTIVWSRDNFSGAKFVSLTGLPQRIIKRHLSKPLES